MSSENQTAPVYGNHGGRKPSDGKRRTMKLFVRNIPFALGDMGLRKLFQNYGTVLEVNVWTPKNIRDGPQRTRLGSVVMATVEMANAAVFGLHEQPPTWLDVQIDISEFESPNCKETLESISKPLSEQLNTRNSGDTGRVVIAPAGCDLANIPGHYRRGNRNGSSARQYFVQNNHGKRDQERYKRSGDDDGNSSPSWKSRSFNNGETLNDSRRTRLNQHEAPRRSPKVIRGRSAVSDDGSDSQINAHCHEPCINHRCDKLGTERCVKCHAVYYCSRECQRQDRQNHESQCIPHGSGDGDQPRLGNRPFHTSGGRNNGYNRGGGERDTGRRSGGSFQRNPRSSIDHGQRDGGHRERDGEESSANRRRDFDQHVEHEQRSPSTSLKSVPFEVGQWSSEVRDANQQLDARGSSEQARVPGVFHVKSRPTTPTPGANVVDRPDTSAFEARALSPIAAVPFDLTENPTKVIVSHAIAPNDFYVQLLANMKILAQMMRHLQRLAARMPPPLAVSEGQLVAAKFSEDQMWYRAAIVGSTEGGWLVKYVDYGNTESVALENLRALDDCLLAGLHVAVHCCLAGSDVAGNWSSNPKIVAEFQTLVANGEVYASLVGRCGNCSIVRLTDAEQLGKDFSQVLRASSNRTVLASCIASWKVGTEVRAVINEASAINRFWLTDITADGPGIDLLSSRLTVVCNNMDLGDQRFLCRHPVVAAKSPRNGGWYRGVITQQLERGWMVVYLDYGKLETVFCVQLLPLPFTVVRSLAVMLGPDDGFTAEQRSAPPPPLTLGVGQEVRLTPLFDHESEVRVAARVGPKLNEESTSPAFLGRALSIWSQWQLPDTSLASSTAAPDILTNILRSSRAEIPIMLLKLEYKRRLYVQLYCEQTAPIFSALQELHEETKKCTSSDSSPPNLGDLVCLRSAVDGLWNRARVIGASFDESGAPLFQAWLVDAGRTETVGISSLSRLPPLYYGMPRVCVAVQPVLRHDGVAVDVLREVMFSNPGTYWSLCVVDPTGMVKVTLKDNLGHSLDTLLESKSANGLAAGHVTILKRDFDRQPLLPTDSSVLAATCELPPPPILSGCLAFYPIFLESIEKLYVHAIFDDTLLLLKELEELNFDIEAAKAKPGGFGLSAQPVVGQTVCALFEEDDTWYRALVEVFYADTAEVDVLFVDYGNRGRCGLANLCPVPPRFCLSRTLASTLRPVTSGGASFSDYDALNEILFEKCDAQWSAVIINEDDACVTKSAVLSDHVGRSLEELLTADATAETLQPNDSDERREPSEAETDADFKELNDSATVVNGDANDAENLEDVGMVSTAESSTFAEAAPNLRSSASDESVMMEKECGTKLDSFVVGRRDADAEAIASRNDVATDVVEMPADTRSVQEILEPNNDFCNGRPTVQHDIPKIEVWPIGGGDVAEIEVSDIMEPFESETTRRTIDGEDIPDAPGSTDDGMPPLEANGGTEIEDRMNGDEDESKTISDVNDGLSAFEESDSESISIDQGDGADAEIVTALDKVCHDISEMNVGCSKNANLPCEGSDFVPVDLLNAIDGELVDDNVGDVAVGLHMIVEGEPQRHQSPNWCDQVESEEEKNDVAVASDSSGAVKELKVVVCEVESAESVYVQPINESALDILVRLEQGMNNVCPPTEAVAGVPQVGILLCARFSLDHKWYRGRVEDVAQSPDVQVRFVDFGNVEIVSLDELKVLPHGFCEDPPVAIQVRLEVPLDLPTSTLSMILQQGHWTMTYVDVSGKIPTVSLRSDDGQQLDALIEQVQEAALDCPSSDAAKD